MPIGRSPRFASVPFLLVGLLGLRAWGQAPGASRAPAEGAAAMPTASSAAPPSPGAPPAAPEGVVTEAPIVAGNLSKARDKALGEARRQVVERSLAQILAESGFLVDGPLPAAITSLRTAVGKNPQSYVRSYRVLEEGEAGGFVRLRTAVDVDDGALRRQVERARAGAPGVARALLVVVAGAPEAIPAVQAALGSAGARAEVQSTPTNDVAEVRRLASMSGRGSALLVSATVEDEGIVRGTSSYAARCHLSVRVLAGDDVGGEKAASPRGFETRAAGARAACLGRAAGEVVPPALAELGQVSGPAGDGRVVTLGLDIVEPAALSPVLRAFRKMGAVSSSEVRRVRVGRAELRVVTRLGAAELVTALRRQLGASFVLTPTVTQVDRAEVEVRFAPPTEAPSSSSPPPPQAAPAPQPGPGAKAQ